MLAKNGHSNWAFQTQPQPGWGWNDVLPYFKRSERNERGADDVGCARLKDLFGLSLEGATLIVKAVFEWRKHRSGMLTTNFAEAGGFIRSALGEPIPDLQLHSSSASWPTMAARPCSATATPATSACCALKGAAA